MDPEWIGLGKEEDEHYSSGPSGGVNTTYGLGGGSSPDWVGLDSEGSWGLQDGPADGAKGSSSDLKDEGSSITLDFDDEMNKIEKKLVSAVKKKSQGFYETDLPKDTILPSGASQVRPVEKLTKNQAKPSDEGSKSKLSLTEAYGSVMLKDHCQSVKHACILAECVPTWLAVADGWGVELIEIFMDQPQKGKWFVEGLGVKNKILILPTIVGVRGGVWRTSSDSVLLVQGSAKFVQRMVTGLSAIGVTSNSHKIIIASSQKIRNLDLSFKFQRLAHDRLGGVTNDVGYIGLSLAVSLHRINLRFPK